MNSRAQPDSEEGVLRDVSEPSPVLAVAFGGLMLRMDGIPPFEFSRIVGAVAPVKKLFLRDHDRAFYHRGVRGFADDIRGLEAALRDAIAQVRAERVLMIGNSGGGYAALMLGRLLGVAEVHAFAPLTFISPDLRTKTGDNRFQPQWSALMSSGRYQPEYGDLRELFRHTPNLGTRFVIHYCTGYELDVVHAEWLAAEPGVELRGYDEGDHGLVRYLRETGELEQLLREMLRE